MTMAARPIDTRSDEEIMAAVRACPPVTDSQKNVWAFWHSGFDNMPGWTKRNVVGWVRRLGPAWTVRVLDHVPGSAASVSRFVPAELLPDAFTAGTMGGRYAATHKADLVRLPLLQLYGGAWIDVGTLLLRHLDDLWAVLEDGGNSYELAALSYPCRPDEDSVINPFLVATRGSAVVERWHRVYLELWKGATEATGFCRHPLLRHLRPYRTPTEDINCHELTIEAEAIMDYGAQVLCLERLRDLHDPDDGFDGRDCFERRIFMLPALREMWQYQVATGFSGAAQFALLTERYDVPAAERSPQWHRALRFVHELLAGSLLMKMCHGPADALESSLADILDAPENDGRDCAPGTFAAYLRYGAVHFDQTRPLEPVK
ncbi:capsule polysaccharide biosynthesis protein, partial [Macrophomina phaseolina]